MSKINISFGSNFQNKEMIESAIEAAEQYVFEHLKITWDVELRVSDEPRENLILEDGVGGRTITSSLIEFVINEKVATESKIFEMVSHELCHAARWGYNSEWMNTLFDGVICEGIATCFEAEIMKDREEKTFFIKIITERSDDENEKILESLKEQLDSKEYDYNAVFFNGNDELPRWAGYSLGYYFVKRYLDKTGKSIEEAYTDKYADFTLTK